MQASVAGDAGEHGRLYARVDLNRFFIHGTCNLWPVFGYPGAQEYQKTLDSGEACSMHRELQLFAEQRTQTPEPRGAERGVLLPDAEITRFTGN
jgi:hypothetical protein